MGVSDVREGVWCYGGIRIRMIFMYCIMICVFGGNGAYVCR